MSWLGYVWFCLADFQRHLLSQRIAVEKENGTIRKYATTGNSRGAKRGKGEIKVGASCIFQFLSVQMQHKERIRMIYHIVHTNGVY